MTTNNELRYYAEQDKLYEIEQYRLYEIEQEVEKLCNDLLQDVKTVSFKQCKSDNSIDNLMKFFDCRLNKNYRDIDYINSECENTIYAKNTYAKLDWNNNHYDVINSFWTTFSYLLPELDRTNYVLIADYNGVNYPMLKKNNRLIKISKKIFALRALRSNTNEYKLLNMKLLYLSDKLNRLASLCHCVANFMPCPDKQFNSVKGSCIAHDYLPVMIDLIQDCINKQKPLIYGNNLVDNETLCSWHNWFVVNYENYCLQDYYKVTTDDKGRTFIEGNQLFTGQTIDNQVPTDIPEIEECIDNMLKRINNRAIRIARLMYE